MFHHQYPASILLLLGLSSAAWGQAPRTDLAEEADLQFELGIEDYRAGQFRDALEHLLESNRLVPNKNVVYNIARSYEKLGRFADAYRHYSDYLDAESDPVERKPAVEALDRIGAQVALLRVESDPPGATLYVDRVDLGARGVTPRTLALPPGPHLVIAEREGFEGAQSPSVELTIGAMQSVQLRLDAILGTVHVEGGPPGAEIRLDREDAPVIGVIPADIRASPGSHLLVVGAPGYETALRVVEIVPKQTVQALVKLEPVTGSVVVNALERGALIEIDGAAHGFTPAVLSAIPAGKHAVRVSLTGYRPFEQEIVVGPDQPVTVDVRLRPEQEVTAASRTAQAIEDAPASVTLITQQEIRAFGYQSIYEALGGTRGLFQTYDHSYEYVGFRGFSRLGNYNNRQLMTLDGHTLNDDNLGASYFGHDLMTDLLDIERIEVVRGPGSALYGTNAFSGVINLVTRDQETMLDPHVSVATFGARTVRARGGVSHAFSDEAGGWVSLGGIVAQGEDFYFQEYDYGVVGSGDCDGDGVEDAIRCDGISENADGFGSLHANTRWWFGDVTFQGYFNGRWKKLPHGSYGSIYADPRTHTNDTRAASEVRWEPELSEKTRLYARAYLDHYEYDGAFTYGDDLTTEEDDPTISAVLWDGTWTGVEPRLVTEPAEWLRITAGAEARFHVQGHLRACYLLEQEADPSCDPHANNVLTVLDKDDSTYQVYAGYAVADFLPSPWLIASLGGRLDSFTTVGQSFNPRGSLILKPTENDTLKLLGGSAFRAPSPYELNFFDDITQVAVPDDDGDGVSDLSPERVATGEIEATHRFNDVTTGTIAAYGSRIESVIDTVDVDKDLGTFRYANLDDRLYTTGAEVEVRRDWRQGTMLALAWAGQRTRVGGWTTDERLTNSPEHMFSLKGALPAGPATVATRLVVETPRLTNAGDHTDPAVLWDVTASGSVRTVKLDWALGFRNLFDWRYAHPSGPDLVQDQVPQIGRNLYASVTKSF